MSFLNILFQPAQNTELFHGSRERFVEAGVVLHVDNLMLIEKEENFRCGLLDFQDALIGPVAYDVMSLLQDARRDVDPGFAELMLEHYREQAGRFDEHFIGDYATLGAQRNAKIVGIFTRLHKRDGKPKYLTMIPRVWRLLEDDLAYPALAPVATWFHANIPAELRRTGGGTIA